jgi:hypothetical protein
MSATTKGKIKEMTTYEKTFTDLGRMVHGRLAKWLGRDVAFIAENWKACNYLVPLDGFNAGITYNRETETYTVYRLDDDLEPLGLIVITINALMVMELFTKRRLIAALEVLK